MTERFHVIVLGGGHNGLVAAARLAQRGKKVALIERRDELGGLAAGRTFGDGFRSRGVLQETACLRPQVVKALRLTDHGLRLQPPAPMLAVEPGGPGLVLHRDATRMQGELARRVARDGERYQELRRFLERLRPMVASMMDTVPPPIGAQGLRGLRGLMGPGIALRRLGRETMLEVARMAPMCLRDWLDEWFEDPLLKAALAGPALQATWCGPWSAGTAALLVMRETMAGDEVEGGPAALVRALSAACTEAGVDVRTETTARTVVVQGGAVTGVELADGTVLEAETVASTLDPRTTLLDLVPPRDLPPDLEPDAEGWRCRGTTAVLNLALSEPLRWAAHEEETHPRVQVGPSLVALERAFDAVKYRQMSEAPVLDVHAHTDAEGRQIATVLVHHAPYEIDGGWTDDARQTLLDRVLAGIEGRAPGTRDRILGHELLVPQDLEREYGLAGGHLHHGEHGLDQLYWMRPMARCAQYATPVTGLFLCGSGSHPGGGITAGPGWLGAERIASI